MEMKTTKGTTEWCALKIPHAARDARVRRCFDSSEAAAVLRELQCRAKNENLDTALGAHCVEDFLHISVGRPAVSTMHVFRRVAFKSISARPVFPSVFTKKYVKG